MMRSDGEGGCEETMRNSDVVLLQLKVCNVKLLGFHQFMGNIGGHELVHVSIYGKYWGP